MKNLLNLSTKLITYFNTNTNKIYEDFNNDKEKYQKLLSKIDNLKRKIDVDKCKARADMIVCKLFSENNNVVKVLKIYENNKLIGVIGDNITKPNIEYNNKPNNETYNDNAKIEQNSNKVNNEACIENVNIEYNNKPNNETYNDNANIEQNSNKAQIEYNKEDTNFGECIDSKKLECNAIDYFVNNDRHTYEIITNEANLNEILNNINDLCLIKMYKHDYRTYKSFTCYILVVTKTKSFLIDTLKIRKIRHKIFKSKTLKYFHCINCMKQFENEFCGLENKHSLNLVSKIFCDWRIRPFIEVYEEIVVGDIDELVKKYVKQITMKEISTVHEDIITNNIELADEEFNDTENYEKFTEYFLQKYNVSNIHKNVVAEIIKLRNFLAKENNESIYYVLTDMQVLKIIYDMPQTRENFILTLERMSAIVREHVSDFIMIIQTNNKIDKE